MTIDERLRRGLRADLDPPSSDGLEVRAGRVLERARRRRLARRTATVVAVAAIVATAVIAAPQVLERDRSDRPADPSPSASTPPPPSTGIPAGSYRVTLFPGGRADELGVVGRWRLEIHEFRAPAHTTVSLGRLGTRSGEAPVAYVEGAFVTDVMSCGLGPGRYAWGVNGTELRFSLIDDPCPVRRYVMMGGGSGHVWHVVELEPGRLTSAS